VLGLLQVLRRTSTASTGDESSRRRAGRPPMTGPSRWFPRSLLNPSTGSAPNYAPATSPRLRRRHSPWPPDRRHHPAKEFPTRRHGRVGARCNPAQIRQIRAGGFRLRGVQPLVHSRYAFPSCLPDPDHLAVLARPVVVRAAVHPHPHPGDQAALSFNRLAATSRWRCPFTTAGFKNASWRSKSATHH